ncbi:hypothetical protein H0B56_04990 [Haloechinothrix sp. YIM 98757]|uniref:Peptidase S1 domain-containing protein n=1 Tax=Haloechinothrix aidingensis TaxID=2752311 RepID=A0A838A8V4_9PSEU|nr:trypsin-like serine protease [Haloechinothrix aidingensis]MBA0124892.1 hypothetical protein [Haloechinothrix aidingensis]
MTRRLLRAAALAAGSALVALVLAPGQAVAQQEVIQPGASITTGDGYCTLNWIYDGTGDQAGSVYGGTAAHCVEGVGQRISLATSSLGEATVEFGEVAFVADELDYAFIEIDTAHTDLVDPALKGHPQIPTGVSTTETAAVGDLIQFSGHGVGFHLTPITQEQRVGILGYNDGTQHYVNGAVSPGDSGGPVANLTDGNKALGLVNTLGAGVAELPYVGEGGVSLEGMFADAAASGFTVTLRTVG